MAKLKQIDARRVAEEFLKLSQSGTARPSQARQDSGAKDMYANPASNTGWGSTSAVNGGRHIPFRISLDYQKLVFMYRGSWVIRAVVDTKPQDQLKSFPVLTCELTPEEANDFERAVAATMTLQKLIEAAKWGRLFGGALAIICLAGEDQADLSKPLMIDDVQPDSYRGLLVVDRWSGMSPSQELVSDIDNPAEYGLPVYYDVYTEASRNLRVHHSRVLRFTGRDLPLFERQIENGWGMSEIECILDELQRYDFTMAGIADLVSRANVLAMKEPMLAQMLSGVNLTQQQYLDYANRMAAVSDTISTNGILAVGEDGEIFQNSYSFGGLSDVARMFTTTLLGAGGYPMARIFGQTNSGLGDSGEGDLQQYYDNADQERNQKYRPILNKLIPVICMSVFGQVPDDLDFAFAPLRSMTAKEKAELAKSIGDTLTGYANAGAFGQKTLLKEIKRTSADTDIGTTITDDDIEAATDDPMGEMMGMGGPDGEGGDASQNGTGAASKADEKADKEK